MLQLEGEEDWETESAEECGGRTIIARINTVSTNVPMFARLDQLASLLLPMPDIVDNLFVIRAEKPLAVEVNQMSWSIRYPDLSLP